MFPQNILYSMQVSSGRCGLLAHWPYVIDNMDNIVEVVSPEFPVFIAESGNFIPAVFQWNTFLACVKTLAKLYWKKRTIHGTLPYGR